MRKVVILHPIKCYYKLSTNMKHFKSILLGAGMAAILFSSCSNEPKLTASGLNPAAFDTVINEKPVALYTLKNANGMEVCITNFGGRIVSIMVPDKDNKPQDVVLGFDNIKQYADIENSPSDFGAAIGRYANRIKNGKINIDGKEIQLPQNNFGHCLHGGPTGWQYQVYEAQQPDEHTLQLTMKSPDGDNNFPGNVTAVVTYQLKDDNSIDIGYSATTDAKTVINMTNHSYFNLSGDANKNIEDHVLYVNSYVYTPTDDTYMTTGDTVWVKGTPMDFMEPIPVGKNVNNFDYKPIKNANGFDHNWCLASYSNGKGNDKQLAASLYCPSTGIRLEVYTNEPGIQVYSGNFLDGTLKGKKGIVYQKHAGICLETQKYPDSPNKKNWPSPYLEPGQKYYSHCIFKFGVVK